MRLSLTHVSLCNVQMSSRGGWPGRRARWREREMRDFILCARLHREQCSRAQYSHSQVLCWKKFQCKHEAYLWQATSCSYIDLLHYMKSQTVSIALLNGLIKQTCHRSGYLMSKTMIYRALHVQIVQHARSGQITRFLFYSIRSSLRIIK